MAYLELFAGVKGIGFSYSKASGNFASSSHRLKFFGGESAKEKILEKPGIS